MARRLPALALLLLALAPALARATHGRLTLSLAASGGGVTDLFPGAGLGPDGVVQVEPAARLDLSLTPAWKAAAALTCAFGTFTRSGFTTFRAGGDAELRLRLEPAEAALLLSAERTAYSQGAPLELSTVTAPSVTEARALRAFPSVRRSALGAEWRAGLLLGLQASEAAGGPTVTERTLAALGGVQRPAGPFTLGATYRYLRTRASRGDFSLTAHALLAAAERRLGPATARGRLEGQLGRTGLGVAERLLRIALSASVPVGERLELEATYAYAVAHAIDRASGAPGSTDDRHLLLLGLRAAGTAVAW